MKSFQKLFLVVAVMSLAWVGCKTGGGDSPAANAYPLTTCIVSDEPLGAEPNVFVYEGQEIKTCCEDCQAEFAKAPAKFLQKLK